jgi:hypothetical protein
MLVHEPEALALARREQVDGDVGRNRACALGLK